MAWTIAACLAVLDVCLSACVLVQMRMIDGLFRSLSADYRANTEDKPSDRKVTHYSMYNNTKGDS